MNRTITALYRFALNGLASCGKVMLLPMILFALFSGSVHAASRTETTVVPLKDPLAAQGCITFTMQTDQRYHNGPGAKALSIKILEAPGIGTFLFKQRPSVCELQWIWARGINADNLGVQIPGLPGPSDYFIQLTWDATAGYFSGYVNGTALRLPKTKLSPWEMPACKEIHLFTDPFASTLLTSEARHLNETEAKKQVPQSLLGKEAAIFGVQEKSPTPLNLEGRLGALIYASDLAHADSVEGWRMEGPGLLTFEQGCMQLRSQTPESKRKDGHIVYWCPQDFPKDFVAEWDMQILSEAGLCIVFFAAQGEEGEDLFDSSLAKRTGIFRHYTQGDINCYHISYYANTPSAPGRITSNIRKNSGFYLVANGPPGIPPGSQAMHKLRLIKDKGRIQLQVDDRVVIDYHDEGKAYGPIHGGGKIGLRQMQWTTAQYRDFRVYALNPALGPAEK